MLIGQMSRCISTIHSDLCATKCFELRMLDADIFVIDVHTTKMALHGRVSSYYQYYYLLLIIIILIIFIIIISIIVLILSTTTITITIDMVITIVVVIIISLFASLLIVISINYSFFGRHGIRIIIIFKIMII